MLTETEKLEQKVLQTLLLIHYQVNIVPPMLIPVLILTLLLFKSSLCLYALVGDCSLSTCV